MKLKAVSYFLLVFFAGSLTSSIFEWLAPLTTIEITIGSDKVIKHIDIYYTGMGEFDGKIGHQMQPGQTMVFQWTTYGEASYQFHATFEDGTEVKGGAGYTSRGKTIKEAIEEKRVMSRLPMDFTFGFQHWIPRDTTSPAGD